MTTIKVTEFDPNVITNYMRSHPEILNRGVAYVRAVNYYKTLTDLEAELTAIKLAQDWCYNKWHYDSSGYIKNEYMAFQEFQEAVEEGRYFNVDSARGQEKTINWGLFLLAFFFGNLGVHRFVKGKIGTGLLYLLTFGLMGFGTLYDWYLILTCKFE